MKPSEAETCFARWLEASGWTVHRVSRPAFIKTAKGGFSRSHDLFGALDVLAIKPDAVWGAQVTTGSHSARTERRRKIEAVAWPDTWRVSLVSVEETPDPVNRARTKTFWRINDYAQCGHIPVAERHAVSDGYCWKHTSAFEFDPKALVRPRAKA